MHIILSISEFAHFVKNSNAIHDRFRRIVNDRTSSDPTNNSELKTQVEPRQTLVDLSNKDNFRGSIFFTDKKKNIIIDGIFTKILYSTQYFTMTGLYINFQVCSKLATELTRPPVRELVSKSIGFVKESHGNAIDCSNSSNDFEPEQSILPKTYIQFNPIIEPNYWQIESLCEIESYILNLYSKTQLTNTIKTPVYCLKTQLYGGYLRAHTEYNGCSSKSKIHRAISQNTGREVVHETKPGYVNTSGLNDIERQPNLLRRKHETQSGLIADSLPYKSNTFDNEYFTTPPQLSQIVRYAPPYTNHQIWTKYIKISGVWESEHTYGVTYKVTY